jgi:hypothetical protein
LCNEKLDGYGVDENEIIAHFAGRGEDRAYAPLTMNSLTGALRGHSLPTFRCQWTRGGLMIGNCMLRDGKEAIWAKRWSVYAALEEEQLDELQLYVEGRERAYGFLGEEMVCVGRGTA